VTDGTSKTFMFAECSWVIGIQKPWIVGAVTWATDANGAYGWVNNAKNIYHPINSKVFTADPKSSNWAPIVNTTNVSMGSMHPGGMNALMCDASTRFVSESIDLVNVYRPLASRASSETIGDY